MTREIPTSYGMQPSYLLTNLTVKVLDFSATMLEKPKMRIYNLQSL